MNDNISSVIRLGLNITVLAMFFTIIVVLTDVVDDILEEQFLYQYLKLDQQITAKMNDYAKLKYVNSDLAYLFIEEFHEKIVSFKHYDKAGNLLESKDLTLYYYEYNAGAGYTMTYPYHERFLINPSDVVKIQINDAGNIANGTVEFTVTEVD